MSQAYIDTSCLVAMAFDEPEAGNIRGRLSSYERLFSSNLLEAELRSALAREDVAWSPALVAPVAWILPARILGHEMERVLGTGYLRGADLWHVACALYLSEELAWPTFLTLDQRQRRVAEAVGLDAPEL
jgi:predicted nucleic acid-binding protein